ncbi:hypothetical protein F4779DRAFT_577309 [Xylariaceae sp. FL0662B]|nr:hypothetical protein F4779DRAFT_577309 [Xylariaceae sp. FL0662B]
MKFAAPPCAIAIACVFSALAMASPMGQGDIVLRDAYGDSRTHDDWVKREVAEGRMFWANDTTDASIELRDLQGRSFYGKLVDVACGVIIGDPPTYQAARSWFCGWLSNLKQDRVESARSYVRDGFCNGEHCKLFMETTFDQHVWKSEDFMAFCEDVFDNLFQRCNARTARAKIVFGSGKSKVEARLVIDWLKNAEATKTCPAKTQPEVACKDHSKEAGQG